MPEISLLQPQVLRGVVEKLTAPETLVLMNRLPTGPWPYPSATWDVVRGSRMVAKPNVPNSEAHIVPRLGVSQETAAFIYVREKKVFEPTTIHWIRTPGQIAARNAEKAVLREVSDLNQRFDNFVEYCCWQMFKGEIVLDYVDVQATIDYKMPSTHKPTVSVSWATATAEEIIANINAWKRLIQRDARVPARTVYLTDVTLERVFRAFSDVSAGATVISDRQKDVYTTTGKIPGLLGLEWVPVDHVYDDDSGNRTLFLDDDSLIMGNFEDNRPAEILEGPSADDEAPDNYTGRFSKTWKEKDPSSRIFLLEYNFLPIMTRPEQFVFVADLTP